MPDFEWTVPGPTASITPLVSDVSQGGIGIFGDFRTRVDEDGELITTLLRFDESLSGDGKMPARDACGGLDDTYAPAGCVLPDKEIGPVGLAAIFDPSIPSAYEAKDLINGGTLHTRNVTVKAILRFDYVAQNAAGHVGTIIARGLGNALSEYHPFVVELGVTDVATRTCFVRFLWQDLAGAVKTQTSAAFIAPTEGYFLLTCTRRWVSPTEVVLRYYVNDRRIAEVTSVDGEIAGGESGHTTIGLRNSGAGPLYLAGAIDELAICNYEMTLEEIEATWLRLSIYQPDGYRQIRDLMPPGIPISDDPDSRVQSDLRTLGIALGFSDARVENMRANLMPDRAYGRVLREWEQITEQPAGPTDSVDRRRARVTGHMAQSDGVSPPGVRTALEALLDCDGDDLEILAFDNTIRDDFTLGLRPEMWRTVDPLAVATVTTPAGLRVQVPAGNTIIWNPSTRNAVKVTQAVAPPRGSDAAEFNGTALLGRIVGASTTLPANAEIGVVLWDWVASSWLLFGVRNTGGVYTVGYQRVKLNVETDVAWVVLATHAMGDHYLRVRPSADQSGVAADGQKYDLSWATAGTAEANFTTTSIEWARRLGWAGYYVRTHTGALANPVDARFGDFVIRNTKGTRPFYFYVYRNPALGGSPDIAGAERVLRRMAHAFTHACVITSKSLMTDDPGSPLDCGPMGAF